MTELPSGQAPPAPNAVLTYCTLETLGSRDARQARSFGPFLKLNSYDPASRVSTLSVLVVRWKEQQQPSLTWTAQGEAAGSPVVAGEGLYEWQGWKFWRFVFKVALGEQPGKVVYKVRVWQAGGRAGGGGGGRGEGARGEGGTGHPQRPV